jgi:hypothetical protein
MWLTFLGWWERLTLVTADEDLQAFEPVATLW